MTPKALTESILLQAFQGKLVPHDSNEGSGKDVLSSLNNELHEKQRLGLIKKSKTAAECDDKEIDFDLPENWEIAKLGYICQLLDGEKRTSQNYPYLEARYLRGKTEPSVLSEGRYVPANTNVILVDGENSGEVFTLSEEGYMGSTFKVLFLPECFVQRYILYFLMLHRSTLRNNKKGAAIPHLNKDIFYNLPLPIPPLTEQKRIVAKLEEILPLIDRYEAAWSKLEEFNKRFPGDMQKSILQLAIQGKLVEQRSEEGTGEELFQQIQAEKQALIKAGKIKTEKPLPEIADDEIPFDIPETWKWCRIGSVFTTSSGTTPAKSNPNYYSPPKYNWVRTTDLNNDFLTSCEIQVSQTAFDECRLAILPQNSVCIAMYGGAGTIGKNALIRFDTTINQSVCAIHPNGLCDMQFVLKYMQFYRPLWMLSAAGSRKDPNINQVIIKNALIPLPPLAEQKRIVAKLEEILPLCDRLK